MMMLAKVRLDELAAHMTNSFGLMDTMPIYSRKTSYVEFVDFLNGPLESTLHKAASEVLAMSRSSKTLPLWFLSVSVSNTLLSSSAGHTCPLCQDEGQQPNLGEL